MSNLSKSNLSKYADKLFTKANAHRAPIAIGAAGICASAALGTGVAIAADGNGAPEQSPTTHRVAAEQADSTRAQAKDQHKQAAAEKKKAKSWTAPVDKPYELSASFGHSGDRWSQKHSGQDFAVPEGTDVSAAHKGTVVTAGWGGAYGNNVVIEHPNGQYTQYAHLSKLDVKPGQKVTTDEKIGKSGNTGNSSGPHLHFEVRTTPEYGSGIDPAKAMGDHGVKF